MSQNQNQQAQQEDVAIVAQHAVTHNEMSVFGADALSSAAKIATAMRRVIDEKGLAVRLGGDRPHVRLEGWQTLGALLGGIMPHEIASQHWKDDDGNEFWEVTVELRDRDGRVYATASGVCGTDEPSWKQRPQWNRETKKREMVPVPSFARRAMAFTRAASRAYRSAFAWVMALAGYDPTPAEEMLAVDAVVAEDDASQRYDTPQRVTVQKKSVAAKPKPTRPLQPQQLREMLERKAETYRAQNPQYDVTEHNNLAYTLSSKLHEIVDNYMLEQKLLNYLAEVSGVTELSHSMLLACRDWLGSCDEFVKQEIELIISESANSTSSEESKEDEELDNRF